MFVNGKDDSGSSAICIVPSQNGSAILVRRLGDQVELPVISLPWQRLEFFPDHVPHIRREFAKIGVDVTVLRHLKEAVDAQICVIEVHGELGPLPEGFVWLETEPDWHDSSSWVAWEIWKECAPATAPWERTGWFAEARDWMKDQLSKTGYAVQGPVEQIKGAWDWSSILTTNTDQGRVYLKADYAKPPKETQVVLKLAEKWPENVPKIIAADIERNWMLMRSFTGQYLEPLGLNAYAGALRQYVAIQRSSADEIKDWQAIGCFDMTPMNLLAMAERLVEDSILRQPIWGLSREDLQEFRDRLPGIRELLNELAASKLPVVIANEDFRAGNVVLDKDRYILFDWSGTVISHPFFSLNYFLNRVIREETDNSFRWRIDLNDDRRKAYADAFLNEWTDLAPRDQIEHEFWLCRRLFHLYEAILSNVGLPFENLESPWGRGSLTRVSYCIRSFLAVLRTNPNTTQSH